VAGPAAQALRLVHGGVVRPDLHAGADLDGGPADRSPGRSHPGGWTDGAVGRNANRYFPVPPMSQRLDWDQYFLTITRQVAERSTCNRAKVGAVIVRDKNILATGYNGSPAGLPHCTEVGCLLYQSTTPEGGTVENCFCTIHAEINAIAPAAKNGAAIRDASIYLTHTPCLHFFKTLINT